MARYEKLFRQILSGSADQNINFNELCNFLLYLEFTERVKGSHHIFFKDSIAEIINIQPKGTKAKAYQVKQVRNIIVKYHLGDKDE